MHIILMAAGRGLRLGDHTADKTKSMVELGGKKLIHHILDSLKPFATDGLTVIGGFAFEGLAAELKDKPVRLLQNTNFTKGNLLTLLCAEKEVTGSFCLFNADHFYSRPILDKIFKTNLGNITAVCDFDRPLTDDDMKIRRNPEGRMQVMKKILNPFDGGYIGVTLVPEVFSKKYWAMAHETLRQVGDQVCVEEVVNRLIEAGSPVDVLDASGSIWIEVDTPEDLAKAHVTLQHMEL